MQCMDSIRTSQGLQGFAMPHPQFPIGSASAPPPTAQAVLAGLTCPTPPPSSPAATPAWDWKPPARWPRPARASSRRATPRPPRADSRHRQGPGRTAGSRQAGQRARFRPALLAGGQHVDMLICGAGIMACLETRVGPGWEAQFATNHLGHYALANLLWPALAQRRARGRRLVRRTPSIRHALGRCAVHAGYDKWLAYGQSKTANALFAPASGQAGTSAWRARLFAASWQDLSRRCNAT